jgi:hypothetical protein
VIVGPGFRDAFVPGYPAKKESVFWEEDFKDRNVIEAPFNMKIGKFDAWDYLGDGSVYVLNVPGHAVGHVSVAQSFGGNVRRLIHLLPQVSALVRTTPDTFVFLGGDVCHFCGQHPKEMIDQTPD